MTPPISQIIAASYNAVSNERNKPANQWAESALLSELEKQGMIDRIDFGPSIECTLDWRINQTAAVTSDFATFTLTTKTDVLTSANYTPAEVSMAVNWSKGDEMNNPTLNQKVDFVDGLLNNAMASNDDVIESGLFTTSGNFISLADFASTDGLGTIGGIVGSTDSFWRSKVDGFVDGLDLEASMESLYMRCEKGTGSVYKPTLIVSDGSLQALFASTQQNQQRFGDQNLKASFLTILFKNARYVYSKYGLAGTQFFLGNKTFSLKVAKGFWRQKGETSEIQNANGYSFKMFSGVCPTTNNRSRLGRNVQAA